MSVFKYFEKGTNDGLLDPNDPLSPRLPSDDSVGRPTERHPGACRISAELAGSEGKKRGPCKR